MSVVPSVSARNATTPLLPCTAWTPSTLVVCSRSFWRSEMSRPIGTKRTPRPMKSGHRATYIRPEAASVCPHARRRARRSGAVGRQAPREQEDGDEDEAGDHQEEGDGVGDELHERPRAVRDGAAEEAGRPLPEHRAAGHGVAPAPPVLRPGDRMRPLLLEVRALRPVEERGMQLAPAPLERDPRIARARGGRAARDRDDRRSRRRRPARASQPTPSDAELPRYNASP